VDTCTDPNCVNADHVNQVNTTLAGSNYAQSPSAASSQQPAVARSYSAPSARTNTYNSGNNADVCRFYLQGNCMYGASCRYRHPQL
jgi:hypothetical protein